MDELAAGLEAAILTGRLQKGSALPSERQLCEAYQLSRTTIRAALQRLMAKRLVVSAGGRATAVDERRWTFDRLVERISAHRGQPEAVALLEDLLRVRRQLLVQAVELACERGDSALLGVLVAELQRQLARHSLPAQLARLERELYEALADASGSAALAMFHASFDRLHDAFPSLGPALPGGLATPVEAWQGLVHAIGTRDVAEGRRLAHAAFVAADVLLLEAFRPTSPAAPRPSSSRPGR